MNALYTNGKEALLDGSIIWTTSNIKVMLVDTDLYTVNSTTDKWLSDIPLGARIAASPILSNRTATAGVADASDVTIESVTSSGSDVGAYVLYDDTGNPASSRLLAYIDDDSGSVLPFTPNGGSVLIAWSNGSDKIFSV